ncbi:MAG: hypothetical protein AB1512_20885 [Thermodesulfobacteriota bacterium]
MNNMKYIMVFALATVLLSAGMAFGSGPMVDTRWIGPANKIVESCAPMQAETRMEAAPTVETRWIGPANKIIVAKAPDDTNPYDEAGPDVETRFIGPANKIVRGESQPARDATGRIVTDAFCNPVLGTE